MAFRDLTSELIGSVPRLDYLNASRLVNRAWKLMQDQRLWSFNVITDGQVFAPSSISTGTVSAVFNSTTMTADATAITALNLVALSNPVLASPTFGVGRQIRLGAPAGPLYTITAWDGAGTITIDRPYGEVTVTGSTYSVYKAYYAPPLAAGAASPTFIRYFSIVNEKAGYSIRGRRLNYTQAQINAIDPQRGATGDPYITAFKGRNSSGQSVYEFYPNPVNVSTYLAQFQIRWPGLSPTQDLPQMPYAIDELLLHRAKGLAGEWALSNVSTYPELAGVNWVSYSQIQDKNFKETRIQCIKMDDEINPLVAMLQGSIYDFPLGGSFLQNHDVSSLIPGLS